MLYFMVGGLGVLAVLYLLLRKSKKFSSEEALLVAKISDEESKVLADFKIGKEDVIAEYERLKSRVTGLVSLKAKLPTVPTPQVVAPVPVAAPVVVQPAVVVATEVAVAPVVESAPTAV